MSDPFAVQQWWEVKNNNAAQIPANGVMRVTGSTSPELGRIVLTVDQPNAYGAQYMHLVNGPTPINPSCYGYATRFGMFPALYDNSADGLPAFGNEMGPISGSWKLRKGSGGFINFALTNAGVNLMLVQACPMLTFRGKTTAIIAPKSYDTNGINVYYGNQGSETQFVGQTVVNVYNPTNCQINSGKFVTCLYNLDTLSDPSSANGYVWSIVVADTS